MSSSDIDRKCTGNNRHTKTERSIQTPAHESIEFITKEGVKKKHAPVMSVYKLMTKYRGLMKYPIGLI
jgi:hypothetical protein